MPRVTDPPVFEPNPTFAPDIYVACVQGEPIERVDGSLVGAVRDEREPGGVKYELTRVVKLTGREQYWSGSRFRRALQGGRLVPKTQQDFENQGRPPGNSNARGNR